MTSEQEKEKEQEKEQDHIDKIDPSNQTGLGAHIWKVPNYGNHADITVDHYMKKMPNLGAWQIFSHGPRSKAPVIQDDSNNLYKLAKKIPLFIHSSYLTSPMRDDMEHIIDQMFAARQYGAQGLIIHIPKASISEIIKLTINMIEAIKEDEYFGKIVAKYKGKLNKNCLHFCYN